MKRNPSLHQFIFNQIQAQAPVLAVRWDEMSPIKGIEDDREARIIANGFWRLQLGMLPTNTIAARACLIETIGYDEWCYDFVKCVIPLIVQNGLPATGLCRISVSGQ